MEEKGGRKYEFRTSYKIGIIAFVFLVIGYQTALLVHRASVMKILSEEPATVAEPATVTGSVTVAEPVVSDRAASGAAVAAAEAADAGTADNPGKAAHNSAAAPQETKPEEAASVSDAKDAVREKYTRRQVESFVFNPNTVSVEDLQRLGFSRKQAQAIDNYRKKGGKFNRKSDFAKSFVVADSVYRRLEAYIDIPLLDLNLADSSAFDALPGIGGYFAAKMVDYRKSLGGSYSFKEQLLDIYNFGQERFDALSDLVYIDPETVKPYRLWTLPEDSLKLHPYIGAYAAHGIVLFRDNNEPSRLTLQNLASANILKPDSAARLSKCIIAPY